MAAILNDKQKSLSIIMLRHKHFSHAVDNFIDALRKKRAWKNIEKNMEVLKERLSEKNRRKLLEWERNAYSIYSAANDKTLELVKIVAHSMTPEEIHELESWIKTNSNSKSAWEKNILSVDDSVNVIKAKVAHLIYMARAARPINIGEIIHKSE